MKNLLSPLNRPITLFTTLIILAVVTTLVNTVYIPSLAAHEGNPLGLKRGDYLEHQDPTNGFHILAVLPETDEFKFRCKKHGHIHVRSQERTLYFTKRVNRS